MKTDSGEAIVDDARLVVVRGCGQAADWRLTITDTR